MREILFRGKRLCNNKWMIGSLLCYEDGDRHICCDNFGLNHYRVDPETVGQFTGLTDKNGKQIFEGDILKDDWGKIYKVFYTTKSCSFMVECTVTPNEWETGNYRIGEAWCETVRVIGNIHDNPELLEDKYDG